MDPKSLAKPNEPISPTTSTNSEAKSNNEDEGAYNDPPCDGQRICAGAIFLRKISAAILFGLGPLTSGVAIERRICENWDGVIRRWFYSMVKILMVASGSLWRT
jgi:hypothetical protein